MGANEPDLVAVYIKQIRCVLELAVPAWQGGLQAEKTDLERIKKTACHIILGQSYDLYTAAMDILQLETLEFRRNLISSLKFSLKAEKHQNLRFWFKPSEKKVNTRQNTTKYCPVVANHTRFEKSSLSFLTKLLNIYYSK